MRKKTLQRSTVTTVSILAFVAILAAINVFLFRHPLRVDLTENKRFTISEGTQKLLSRMTDDVNITLYVSENLPPPALIQYRDTREFLEELTMLSGGRIRLRIETPKDDKETEEALARKGIQRAQINILEKDEYKVAAIYYHLYIQHLDKSRVLAFPSPSTLEYQIASALVEVTQREKPVVAFVTNDPKFRFGDLFGFLRDRLEMGERFDLRHVSVEENHPLRIPAKCKTLILVRPRDFKESDLYKIDQFVMGGGSLVVFVEPTDYSNPMAMFRPTPPPNIVNLLNSYGVKVNTDLVSDYRSFSVREMPAGQRGMITYYARVPYPQWVVATTEGFNSENPALAHLQQLLFAYPSSLEFRDDLPEGAGKQTLITTTDRAQAQSTPPFDLEPPKLEKIENPGETKKFTLVLSITGAVNSHFKDQEPPAKEEEPKEEDAFAFDQPEEEPLGEQVKSTDKAKIVVISTAQFLNPEFLQSMQFSAPEYVQTSLLFVQNLVDWLSLGEDLIAIRTKPAQRYFLRPELTDSEKAAAKFFGRFAVPLLVILLGLIWWWLRRLTLIRNAQVYGQ